MKNTTVQKPKHRVSIGFDPTADDKKRDFKSFDEFLSAGVISLERNSSGSIFQTPTAEKANTIGGRDWVLWCEDNESSADIDFKIAVERKHGKGIEASLSVGSGLGGICTIVRYFIK